jgi:hypothetical protein
LWLLEKGVRLWELEIGNPDAAYASSATLADMGGRVYAIRNSYLVGSNWKQVDFHNIPMRGVVTFDYAPKKADNPNNINELWLVIGNYNEPTNLILNSMDVLELSASVTQNKIQSSNGLQIKNLITPNGNNGTGFTDAHNKWKFISTPTPKYELVSNFGSMILQVNKADWANNVKDGTVSGNLGNTPPAGNTIN